MSTTVLEKSEDLLAEQQNVWEELSVECTKNIVPENVLITMQDYESLRGAVKISDTLVNTQTDRQTDIHTVVKPRPLQVWTGGRPITLNKHL